MQAAAEESGLFLGKPLTSNRLANGLDIDEIECSSNNRAFLQCAISASDAVLLLSYDAPLSALAGYAFIVNSVAHKHN